MSEIIKEFSENETIQNKAIFFESLFIIIHKENGVLKEENTLIIEENITLTKNNSSLTKEVEYLKQIIANKDREIKFNEVRIAQKKKKYEKTINNLYEKKINNSYEKNILNDVEESTVILSDNKGHDKELVNDSKKRKIQIDNDSNVNFNGDSNSNYNDDSNGTTNNNYNGNYNNNYNGNYNNNYNGNYNNNYNNNYNSTPNNNYNSNLNNNYNSNLNNNYIISPKNQKKYYRLGNPDDFLTNLYSNLRRKYIYAEEILINLLQNTNMKSGEIRNLFQGKKIPYDIYLTLSCYHKHNNNSFMEGFWKDKNNENTNFAIIFNKRNPNFVITLRGKGTDSIFEKV